MMPAYPFGSPCIFTLEIVTIYGLIAYGSRLPKADRRLTMHNLTRLDIETGRAAASDESHRSLARSALPTLALIRLDRER